MRIHHLALRSDDVARSGAFYRDLLRLPELRRIAGEDGELRALWLDAEGAILMIERALRGRGSESGSGHLLALRVDDLGAWEARLAAAGVPIVDRTPHTLYASDPDGHRIGLSTYVLTAG